jgi:hypothetical protein
MNTKTYRTYEEAAQDYVTRFHTLREAPPAPVTMVTRGAGEIAAETLIEQADQIADVSASMVPFAKGYLEAPDPILREGISGQLLAQSAAELQVAIELMHITGDESAGTAAPVTRAARGANLRDAIDSMEKAMAMPVSAGLITPGMVQRAMRSASDTPEQAKTALQQAVVVTDGAIAQRVVEVGGDLAFNLVFNTEWAAVIESAGLLNKDIAGLLDRVKEGAGALVRQAVTVAVKTVANVYDKIIALLGKDAEDEARQRIKKWLEDIQKSGKIALFEQLVGKLYRVKDLEAALPKWLEKTTADTGKIDSTAAEVAALSDKFTTLVGRINTVGDVLGLAKFIQAQIPQILVIVTGIRVILLAVLVGTGRDYIGYEQGTFLNLTKGVAEVVRENLGVAE